MALHIPLWLGDDSRDTSTVSAADQDRKIGAPEGGRRAIASKAVSTGVKPIRDFEFSLILIIGKVIQCELVNMEDRVLRDSDPLSLVGQTNTHGGVVLIVCEGSCSCWGIDQPSVSDDFGLRYLNLRTWCCFGGGS